MLRPNGPPPTGFYHGWYSAEQNRNHCCCIYENENGDHVIITEVNDRLHSNFEDAKYVGLVKENGYVSGQGLSKIDLNFPMSIAPYQKQLALLLDEELTKLRLDTNHRVEPNS